MLRIPSFYIDRGRRISHTAANIPLLYCSLSLHLPSFFRFFFLQTTYLNNPQTQLSVIAADPSPVVHHIKQRCYHATKEETEEGYDRFNRLAELLDATFLSLSKPAPKSGQGSIKFASSHLKPSFTNSIKGRKSPTNAVTPSPSCRDLASNSNSSTPSPSARITHIT